MPLWLQALHEFISAKRGGSALLNSAQKRHFWAELYSKTPRWPTKATNRSAGRQAFGKLIGNVDFGTGPIITKGAWTFLKTNDRRPVSVVLQHL